jgi:hypothetical protein
MRSKLLQKKIYAINQSREEVDGQQENDSSRRTKGPNTLPNPANPAVAQAGKDTPALLKRDYRTARG